MWRTRFVLTSQQELRKCHQEYQKVAQEVHLILKDSVLGKPPVIKPKERRLLIGRGSHPWVINPWQLKIGRFFYDQILCDDVVFQFLTATPIIADKTDPLLVPDTFIPDTAWNMISLAKSGIMQIFDTHAILSTDSYFERINALPQRYFLGERDVEAILQSLPRTIRFVEKHNVTSFVDSLNLDIAFAYFTSSHLFPESDISRWMTSRFLEGMISVSMWRKRELIYALAEAEVPDLSGLTLSEIEDLKGKVSISRFWEKMDNLMLEPLTESEFYAIIKEMRNELWAKILDYVPSSRLKTSAKVGIDLALTNIPFLGPLVGIVRKGKQLWDSISFRRFWGYALIQLKKESL